MKKTLAALAVALATSGVATANAANTRADRYVECLIGKAGVYLHTLQNKARNTTARTATDMAMEYADKQCKSKANIGEGGGDYVYHSIHGMAKEWFGDEK